MHKVALIFFSGVLLCLTITGPSQASVSPAIENISSEGNGTLEALIYEVPNAKATLVMLPGGSWNIGDVDASSGMLTGKNFFIRTIPAFLAQEFNVVTMGKPKSAGDLQDSVIRAGKPHAEDVLALAQRAHRLGKPVWLLGTSMGGISAVNAATADTKSLISGIVISSPVAKKTTRILSGTLDFPLESIRVPAYVSGHEKDGCGSTPPSTTKEVASRLTSSKKVLLKMTQSGSDPSGNPCGPTHWHGYINAESEVVQQMSDFIKSN